MTNNSSKPGPTFLSTLPVGRRQWQLALAVAATSLLVFLAALPFASVKLGKMWAFIPIYETALIVNDLTTAILLLGQYMINRTQSMRILICGYLFTALMASLHALSFPGLFADAGLLGGSAQSTAWLYMFWHGGFPLCIIAYARLNGPTHGGAQRNLLVGAISVALAAGAFAFLALANGGELLPPIMQGNGYSGNMSIVVSTVWLLSLAALGALWRHRRRSVLDLWLMVVMCAWLCDIALSAMCNAGRFDLGFYAGRLYGLCAATFVLLVLLVENGWLYARLIETTAELQRLAIADPLTGIANRRAFDDALQREWRRSARTGEPLSLMMIDIDYFKGFNDHYGHVAGDECLRTVAIALASIAQRSGDVAARYGGEEFALLLPHANAKEASRLAQRICESIGALRIPHAGSQVAQCVTVSVGLAGVHAGEMQSAAELVLAADKALYAAKESGRNRVCNAHNAPIPESVAA